MRHKQPARAQNPAADGEASVWVAASAGTGKTKILTDRVLALMLQGSDPARILCLTFTRAAAAEMANRLNDRLSSWAVVDEGRLVQELQALLGSMPDAELIAAARRLFARVLDAPGGMKIETIHAFCQSLLRRFPLEARVAPHFELMDERNAGEALAEARDAMLAVARRGGDVPLGAALAHVTRHAAEKTFDDLMKQLVLERTRLARALDGGADRFRDRVCALLDIEPDAMPEAIVADACAGGDFGLGAVVARMTASGSVRDRERGDIVARFLAAPPERPAMFDEYCSVFFTQDGNERNDILTKPLVASSPDGEAALRAEAARLGPVRRRRAAAALKLATLALATLGDDMLERYRRHKEAGALLDYEDLVLAARDLLCRPGVAPWVLFKLDGGLDHILIDEAQDTNPEQWEVVAALAEEFFAGASARALRRTVFAVGDAKQSIFSFQRADPAAFLRMRDHFAARARAAGEDAWRTVALEVSYRSTPAVLTAVDAVFARAEAHAGVALDGAPIRHRPSRAGQGGLVELWPPVEPLDPPALSAWDPPVEQRRMRAPPARLAYAIAETIDRWIRDKEQLEARDRRVRAGDVLVLVRRRGSFVAELVRALKERAVPVAGADRMKLTEQLAVEDMMALLQFLLLPEDDLTLATVLKGPLIGFDDELLFDLAHRRGAAALWHELRRRAGERPEFADAAARLGALLGRADFAPPYELLAEVLGAGEGRMRMLARLGPDAADPLDELLAASLAYERRHGPSLQGFLHWLAAGDIEVKRDLDQRGRDEVRIMTVHGAKGLQAPIVFLPDTLQVPRAAMRLLWTEDGVPLWRAHDGCGAPASDRAHALAQQRRDEEYRRLLYVAMTRAEDRLYVCGWHTKNRPPAGNWYELIQAGLGDAAGVATFDFATSAALGADGWAGTGLRLVSPQLAPAQSDVAPTTRPDHESPLPGWVRRPPPPEPVPPRPLAPSRPQSTEPAPRSPLGADAGTRFRRGLMIHRLLQSLPQLPPAERRPAAARFLARPLHRLDPAEQAALVAEAMGVLEDPEAAALFGPDSVAEVPIVAVIDGRALSGRIDRLVERDGAVAIVDYKTLRPVPASEAAIPPAYLEQLRAYRAAVAEVYPGRPVRCALLWTDGPKLMWVSDALLA